MQTAIWIQQLLLLMKKHFGGVKITCVDVTYQKRRKHKATIHGAVG